jgi:transcriptional regulator with XRE-family HTH domain
MNNKQIALYIKKRRKQLNITQQELSLISGVSTRKLSNIETASGGTTIDILNKICEVLGLEISLSIKGLD